MKPLPDIDAARSDGTWTLKIDGVELAVPVQSFAVKLDSADLTTVSLVIPVRSVRLQDDGRSRPKPKP